VKPIQYCALKVPLLSLSKLGGTNVPYSGMALYGTPINFADLVVNDVFSIVTISEGIQADRVVLWVLYGGGDETDCMSHLQTGGEGTSNTPN
jgi:hypothetical protein